MKSFSTTSSALVARTHSSGSSLSLSAALGDQLAALYGQAERSDYVFGSPLGPFYHAGHLHYLPRFVYFGPHTSEESPRMAFLAGLDSRDLRPTLAMLRFIEELALKPDLGQSLHLAFYPLVDVLGQQHQAGDRDLSAQVWATPTAPEIGLLAKEAVLRQYHTFVRIESVASAEVVSLRLRSVGGTTNSLPLISSEDTEPYEVRFEIDTQPAPAVGPLSLGEALLFLPLELTLRVPATWPPEYYRDAVATILKRFIVRYREFLSYGQHL